MQLCVLANAGTATGNKGIRIDECSIHLCVHKCIHNIYTYLQMKSLWQGTHICTSTNPQITRTYKWFINTYIYIFNNSRMISPWQGGTVTKKNTCIYIFNNLHMTSPNTNIYIFNNLRMKYINTYIYIFNNLRMTSPWQGTI